MPRSRSSQSEGSQSSMPQPRVSPNTNVMTKIKSKNAQTTTLVVEVDKLRKEMLYTDIIITCEGQNFATHRVILHASCLYFRKLFEENAANLPPEVNIDGIGPDVLEVCLQYMYTGSVSNEYTEEVPRIRSLVAAAILFELQPLVEYCWSQLSKSLKLEEYLDIWNTADEFKNTTVLTKVKKFVAENFPAVSLSPEFTKLTRAQLEDLFRTPEVNNFPTDTIVQGLFNWIHHDEESRKESISSLLAIVDYKELTNRYLAKLLNSEPLITECKPEFGKLFAEALNRLVFETQQAPQAGRFFACCGKRSNESGVADDSVIVIYDFVKKYWSVPKVLPFPLDLGTAVASVNGDIYFIGGGIQNGTGVYKFFLGSNSFTTVASLPVPINRAGAGVLRQKIYLVGGFSESETSGDRVFCYDTKIDLWSCTGNTNTVHSTYANVVNLGDQLYIVGSFQNPVIERLDEDTRQWTEIGFIPSPLAEHWPRATAHQGRIWIVRDTKEKKFHIFDPVTFDWEMRFFEGGPDDVYSLWSVCTQSNIISFILVYSCDLGYQLYDSGNRAWIRMPTWEDMQGSYYWQSLFIV